MVTKMPVARVEDIATTMRAALAGGRDIEIVEIGPKPGEKMYEELMNEEEVRRTREHYEFFVILSAFADQNAPAYAHLKDKPRPDRPYNSAQEPAMSRAELTQYFQSREIL